MLLRNRTKHVKNQNWFAVIVDFIIVVFGVFLGIQIGDWNNERLTHDRAAILTERLRDDFGVDIWFATDFYQYHKTVIENAKLVLGDLTNRQRVPDEELQVAAYRASQFIRFTSSSTYKELLSSGGYELLAQSELGKIATIFYESTQTADIQNDGKSSDYRRLYRSLIPIEVQLKAAELCGDRQVTPDRIMNYKSMLSYDCKLGLSKNQLSEATVELRSHPEVIEALRRRIANLTNQLQDFKLTINRTKPFRASKEVLIHSAGIDFFGTR